MRRAPGRATRRGVVLGLLALAAGLGPGSSLDALAQLAGGDGPYRWGSRGPLRRTLSPQGPVTTLVDSVWVRGNGLAVDADTARIYEAVDQILLIGNVEVDTDSLRIWSRRMRLYERQERAFATGNVRVRTLDGTLGTGRRGYYSQASGVLALAGQARLIDGPVMVEGDSLHFARRANLLRAYGNVVVVDERSRTVVEGERGIFDRAAGEALVDSVPHLRSRRDGQPEIDVVGRRMGFAMDGSSNWAQGDVVFRQGPTTATADSAYFAGRDRLLLVGAPRVVQEGRVMSGERIEFQYEDGELRLIEVWGDASLVDAGPDTLSRDFDNIPLANELAGDSLRIWVEDDEIRRTLVWGGARSQYLPEDQSSTVSVNTVSGDRIDIAFGDQGVETVSVRGSVDGDYRFVERATVLRARASAADSAGAVADSATADPDSSRAPVDFETSAQVVGYQGDETRFEVQRGRIRVSADEGSERPAQVTQGTLELSALDIWFDTTERELRAEGDPVLVDRESRLVGERMGYLFDPQTGAVGEGATRFDDGFYYGEHIRRIDGETLMVSGGRYTTCDLAAPHYHFHARRMKLRLGESVAARQVTFLVSDLPIAMLPFYYKSLKEGRRSGILFPRVNIGVSSREGRYVRDVGYYWATNEYTDFRFELDYNERREATFTLANRYNVRYRMGGEVRLDYRRRFDQSTTGDEWRLKASHRQPRLWDLWSANASIDLSGGKLTSNNLSGDVRQDLLDSQLRSNAALSRSFENGAQLSLAATSVQRVNAEDEDVGTDNELYRLTLPSARLSFSSRPLLSPLPAGRDGNFFGDLLRDTQFSQNYSGNWDRTVREESREDVVTASGNFGLTFAPSQRVGPFRFTSSARFSERYRLRDSQATILADSTFTDPVDSTTTQVVYVVDEVDEREESLVESLDISNSLGTDLYGIFDTRLGPLRGIKHKASWSMSHNWRPKLGEDQPADQNFSFSLRNEFSAKVVDGSAPPDTTTGEEATRKLNQLISWSLNSSYDPDGEVGARWSDIRSSVGIRPGVTQAISLDLQQVFDPYARELRSTTVSSQLRLNGEWTLGGPLEVPVRPRNELLERLPDEPDSNATSEEGWVGGFGDDGGWDRGPALPREETGRNAIGWDFSSRLSYTRTTPELGTGSQRATASVTAGMQLPGSWRFDFNGGLDLQTGEFTNQYWRASRDLHCWRLEFYRGVASGSDFGFSLYLLQIPDIRVDRGQRGGGQLLQRGTGLF